MKIRCSNTQYDFLKDRTKFAFCTGGYKFGKTWVLARKAIMTLIETKQDGLLAEPTYRMNEDLLRPALEEAMQEMSVPYTWFASGSLYKTPYGRLILRTQDKRSSLEGHNIGWFGLDEMDLIPKQKNEENWRTLLSKLTKGKKQYGFGVGTNEGYEFIYDKFYKGSKRVGAGRYERNEYKLFIGSTKENERHLPDGYFETLYENYDKALVKRYIDGEFVNIKAGRVYTNFKDRNKVSIGFDASKPVYMTWDVNYSDRPMSTTIIQPFRADEIFSNVPDWVSNKTLYVATAGFYNKNTDTEAQCDIIYRYLQDKDFNAPLTIYGDRVGHDRRVGAPLSHYKIVENWFNGYKGYSLRTRTTRSIIDRVASLQHLMENAKGEVRFFVNDELEELITDFEQVSWKSNKSELDGSSIDRTDPSDSVTYWSQYEHDMTRGGKTEQL